MPNRRWVVLASAVALVLACDGATAPQVCPSVPLTVTVTSSTSPTFTWTPNCAADKLIVYEVVQPSVGPDLSVWSIEARASGVGTGSPVVYGHVPVSMRQTAGPFPLGAGRFYRVSIRNAARVELGSKLFGPF